MQVIVGRLVMQEEEKLISLSCEKSLKKNKFDLGKKKKKKKQKQK
jgi:hypothetical protein